MLTERTKLTAAEAITSYIDSRGVYRQFVANRLGLHKSVLSRMLRNTGRSRGEHMTPEIISRIAVLLEVSRATEAEWLGLLETDRQPASVA